MTKYEEMSGFRFWIFNMMPLKNRSVCGCVSKLGTTVCACLKPPIAKFAKDTNLTVPSRESIQTNETFLKSFRYDRGF